MAVTNPYAGTNITGSSNLTRDNYSGVLSESSGSAPIIETPYAQLAQNFASWASGIKQTSGNPDTVLFDGVGNYYKSGNLDQIEQYTLYKPLSEIQSSTEMEVLISDVAEQHRQKYADYWANYNSPYTPKDIALRSMAERIVASNIDFNTAKNLPKHVLGSFSTSVYQNHLGANQLYSAVAATGEVPNNASLADYVYGTRRQLYKDEFNDGKDLPGRTATVEKEGFEHVWGADRGLESFVNPQPGKSFSSVLSGAAGATLGSIADDLGIGGKARDLLVDLGDEAQEHPLQMVMIAGSIGYGLAAAGIAGGAPTIPAAYDVGAAASASGGLGAADPLALGLSESTALTTASNQALTGTAFGVGASGSTLVPGTGTAATGFEAASLGGASDNVLANTVFDTAAVDAALTSTTPSAVASNTVGGLIDTSAAADVIGSDLVAQDILLEPGLGSLAGGGISLGDSAAVTGIADGGAGLDNILGTGAATNTVIPPAVPITDQVAAATGGAAAANTVTGSVAGDILAGGAAANAVGGSTIDDIANNGAGVNDILGGGDSGGLFSGDFWGDFWGSSEDGTGLAGIIGGITGAQNDSLANVLGQIIGGSIDQGNIEDQQNLIRELYGQAIEASDPFGQYRDQYATRLNNLYEDPSSIAALPNYQFMMDQGTQAINRSAAAKGGRLSGNVLYELQEYGQGLASQVRNEELTRLSTLAGANVNPGNAAQPLMSMANQLTGLSSQSDLAWGNRLNNIFG